MGPASASMRLSGGGLRERLRDTLVYLLGWPALVLQQDVPAWDRWRWLRRELRPGALRTLDAGSGSGAFAIYAAERGNVVLGLSFDESANQRAARRASLLGVRRVGFRRADLRQLDEIAPELGGFDQIICLEVIEHILQDQKLLVDLAGLLRPGGRLLISTPWSGHRPLVGETLSDVEDGGHVRWGYTHERLASLMEGAGLEVIGHTYMTGVLGQRITNLSRRVERLAGSQVAWAVTLPFRLALLLDRPVTRLLRYPWLAIAAVGVKP
ncbi:MAG: methyltransferase domain-containing protein [Gemmatimonadales bacterium]